MSRGVYGSQANNVREEWTSGQRLERYLYDHGVSKYALARKSGVTEVTIYRICNGECIGNLETWTRIAQALETTVSAITGR